MNEMRRGIGVCGFMRPDEVHAVIALLDRLAATGRIPPGWPGVGQLRIGVLASEKTLRGQENRHPLRYPKREDIAAIFEAEFADPRVANFLHVAADPHSHSILPTMMLAVQYAGCGGDTLDGYQINVPWPLPRDVEILVAEARRNRRRYPARLLLQVGPLALAQVDRDPKRMRDLLSRYRTMLDEVLIDPSGGTGRAVDLDEAERLLAAAREALPHARLGLAGGLDAQAVAALAEHPLWRAHPDLFIDTESRVRTDDAGGGHLDLEQVRSYLLAAARADMAPVDAIGRRMAADLRAKNESPAARIARVLGPSRLAEFGRDLQGHVDLLAETRAAAEMLTRDGVTAWSRGTTLSLTTSGPAGTVVATLTAEPGDDTMRLVARAESLLAAERQRAWHEHAWHGPLDEELLREALRDPARFREQTHAYIEGIGFKLPGDVIDTARRIAAMLEHLDAGKEDRDAWLAAIQWVRVLALIEAVRA